MGLAFSRIWERMFGKKEMRILMVNSGVEIKILQRVRAESQSTAASSPRNDLVKNCRVHPTH